MRNSAVCLVLLLAAVFAQDRDTLVRNDKADFKGRKTWVYNNVAKARALAKKAGKPLMVVIRCIP